VPLVPIARTVDCERCLPLRPQHHSDRRQQENGGVVSVEAKSPWSQILSKIGHRGEKKRGERCLRSPQIAGPRAHQPLPMGLWGNFGLLRANRDLQ
jgi:hypothetical protein